ncbi:MAG: hypothetical protein OHK0021_17340 [Bryobacter sp.]
MAEQDWEKLGEGADPSWYLDPLVARQKREVNLALVQAALRYAPNPQRVLKTDLFEDAFGEDELLGEFPVSPRLLCGVELAFSTTQRAQSRFPHLRGQLAVGDLRNLPFRPGSFDLIVSTSSLDHFATVEEWEGALLGLLKLLAPGGVALLTFDNPANPLYHCLRWGARLGLLPFALGFTPNLETVERRAVAAGYTVLSQSFAIYNPRGLSTALFLGLRKLLGGRADGAVRWCLQAFAKLGKTGLRRRFACFHASILQAPD